MANRDDQYLRQLFSQKFEHYDVRLPDEDWEMFVAKRRVAQERHRRALIVRWLAAACLISLMIGGFSALFFHHEVQQPMVSTLSPSSLKIAVKHQNQLLLSSKSIKKGKLVLANATPVVSEPSNSSALHSSVSTLQEKCVGLQQNLNKPLNANKIMFPSSIALVENITNGVSEALAAQFVEKITSEQDSAAQMQHLENLPELPSLADQNHSTNTTKHHSSVGWLALHVQGNNGLPTNFSNANAWMQPASLDYRLLTQVNRNAAPVQHASSSSQMITFIDKKTYAFPISWGVTFSQPLLSRWDLQTGLSFTQLVTTGEVTSTLSNRATGRIEQNYLGIPIKIAYSFVNQPSFSLYVSSGGSIEKGVSLVEKIYNYNSQNAAILQDSYSTGIHGFQFSLDANVGATYRLYRFLFIYMETGGAYYIPCDQPESYRTVHPVSVSLKFGLQFKLYHK